MGWHGFLFALLTALLWGIAPVFEKSALLKISPLAGVTLRSISIAVIFSVIILSGGYQKELFRIDSKTFALIVCGGIISGLIGQWTYFHALKYWKASRVVPIVGIYPLFAFIFSLTFLGERLTIEKGIGVFLVVLGIILLK
jgi:transporter family protein